MTQAIAGDQRMTQQAVEGIQEVVEDLQNRPTPVNMGIVPALFKGKQSENATNWLQKFNAYADFNQLPNDRKAAGFRMLMTGPAEMWVNELPAQVRDDYEALTAAFIAYFENADLDWMLEQELSERKQGADESVEDYAANIKSRCARLRKTLEEQLHYFLAGLRNDIKSQVIVHQPQTIDEARWRARLSEIVCHMQDEEKKKNGADLSAIELSVERLAQKTEQLLQQHLPQYVYNPPQFQGPRLEEGQIGTASLTYQVTSNKERFEAVPGESWGQAGKRMDMNGACAYFFVSPAWGTIESRLPK
ncbi:uncharacterized protein LOC144353392 [Saccoglossus kowalevskii]